MDTSRSASLGASGESGLVGTCGQFRGIMGVRKGREREQVRWFKVPGLVSAPLDWDTSSLPLNLVENVVESVSSNIGAGQSLCEAAHAGLTLGLLWLPALLPWHLSLLPVS